MFDLNPETDLEIVREIAASPERLWRAWTTPEELKIWWAPKPVELVEVAIDPVPGGRFFTRMRMPDGAEMASEGCILVAEPARRLVFCDALSAGFRPNAESFFTGIILMEPAGKGTRYTARVLHKDAAGRKSHEEMGFFDGWGTVIDQLAAHVAE